jgi:PIN domain nuclease of toxin-antitoxin system
LAIETTTLPPWIRRRDRRPHRDPVDRFLVTTARRKNAILVSCDEAILDYASEDHVMALDARA